MSTLYVEEITTTPIDTIIRITKNFTIKHIRPHIYREGFLTNGQLRLEVLEGSTVLSQSEIDYTELNNVSLDQYVHGFFKFDFNIVLHHNRINPYTEYILRLSMVNYTPSSGISVNIVTDTNDPVVNLHDNNTTLARGFEIYTIFNF